jgi:(R,R)-butanediol dehydrogenase / meso-butanediol dehydrogenase / diacetyl reductase
VRLPDEVSFEQGAILEPLATVVRGVERSGLRPGGSVLITGGGPIGQLAVLVCAAAGAGAIFVSEPRPSRRRLAERLGATEAFDPSVSDVPAELADRTDGRGADAAIECSGSQPGLDACVASVRRAGTVAVIAIHLGPCTVRPEGWVWRDLTVAGVLSFKFYDTPRILAQVAAGTLPVEQIVTSRIDIHDLVPAGMERLADPGGDQVKILVSPGNGARR